MYVSKDTGVRAVGRGESDGQIGGAHLGRGEHSGEIAVEIARAQSRTGRRQRCRRALRGSDLDFQGLLERMGQLHLVLKDTG